MSLSSFEPAKDERRDRLESSSYGLLVRDLHGTRTVRFQKAIESFGADESFDHALVTRQKGLLFTVVGQGSRLKLLEGESRLSLNKRGPRSEAELAPGDLIEWKDGHAVVLQEATSSARSPAIEALARFSTLVQERGAVDHGLGLFLKTALKVTRAERATLVAEEADGSGWRKLAESRDEEAGPAIRSRELVSHTALKQAMETRRPVVISNLIDHPWSRLPSLVGSRIYSLACLPLIVEGRPFGALFLFTHSPGREIEAAALEELALVTGQVALLVATQSELQRVRREAARLRAVTPVKEGPYWGSSEATKQLLKRLEKLAPSPLPLLVLGETGTGKEVVAREIHAQSPRAAGPFVALNCAAIPETLIESTLFGHEKGAFTGAVRAEPGRFRLASGGTLFLDEIGELPLDLQAKLLRVLQEGEVEPVGARAPVKVNVRIVAATHRNLEEAVAKGSFRQDLYFRLRGAEIAVPALRERREDIPGLAASLIATSGLEVSLSDEARRALLEYPWPGNVRELQQVLQKAAWLSESGRIEVRDLGLPAIRLSASSPTVDEDLPLRDAQKQFTDNYVQRVLTAQGGRRAETAAILGVSERTLYRMLAEIEGDSDGSST